MVPTDRAAVHDGQRRGATRGLVLAGALALLVALLFRFADRAPANDGAYASTAAVADADADRGRDEHASTRADTDDVAALRAATIGGRVASEDGQPIAKAEVCAWQSDATATPQCTRTGADGRYQIEAVPRSVILS